MSIISRARKIGSNIKKKVTSAFSSAKSAIGNAAKNSLAAVVSPFSQAAGKSSLPASQPNYKGLNNVEQTSSGYNNMSTPLGDARGGVGKGNIVQATVSGPKNIYGDLNRSSRQSTTPKVYYGANSYGGSAPVPKTIGAGQRSSSSSSSSSASSTPSTSSSSLSSSLAGGDISSRFGISSESMSSSPSISLPSAPSYGSVSSVTNAGLAGAVSETQTYDPESGLFVPNTADANAVSEEERRKKDFEELLGMTPKKDSVYDDKEVKRQQKEVKARQEEVNNYTAQLNNIVAKRDADLLKVRGVGAEEGVTEAVYGGQATTIEREAAIRALPIQAQVAAAQGNLELAQDYLSELITVKRDMIDADYEYNKLKFSAIEGFLSKEEKIRLDKITKDEDRAYDRAQKNLDLQDSWAKTAIENGQNYLVSRIHALNAGDPQFQEKLGQIIAGIQDKDVGDGSGSIDLTAEDRRILAGGGFSANEIDAIASDVSKYGIDSVLEGLTDKRQKDAVMKVYGGAEDNTQFLTRDYFESLFTKDQLEEAAATAGFTAGGFLGAGVGKQGISDYLDYIEKSVASYRTAGYTDQEILKMMQ